MIQPRSRDSSARLRIGAPQSSPSHSWPRRRPPRPPGAGCDAARARPCVAASPPHTSTLRRRPPAGSRTRPLRFASATSSDPRHPALHPSLRGCTGPPQEVVRSLSGYSLPAARPAARLLPPRSGAASFIPAVRPIRFHPVYLVRCRRPWIRGARSSFSRIWVAGVSPPGT